MEIISTILNSFFGFFFFPFKTVDPFWGMLFVSFVSGIVMLLIFKATSDQAGIKTAKKKVRGHFLAIRLYRDDLGLMFGTVKSLFVSNVLYLKKAFRPMLFLILPVGIILIHIAGRYEKRPLRVGETTVLSLKLNDNTGWEQLKKVEIDVPDGLKLETPPVRIAQLMEISWRIGVEEQGEYWVTFKLADDVVKKKIHVTDELLALDSKVTQSRFFTLLSSTDESSLPESGPFSAIEMSYPKREFDMLGFELHWLLSFFLLSLISGFAFKRFLRVEF